MKRKLLLSFILAVISSSCVFSPRNPSPADIAEAAYRLQTRYEVNGVAMAPALPEGSVALIDEAAYEETTPKRGDVILLQFPADPERLFLKRVIGLPGEQIEVKDGTVCEEDSPETCREITDVTYERE